MANWFIRVGMIEQGPFVDAQLRKLALSGQIRSDTLVRREGSDRLVGAGMIKGLTFSSVPIATSVTALPSPQPAAPPPTPPSPSSRATHVPTDEFNPRLTYCPDCGRMISKSATSCPNCGRTTSTRSRMTALLLAWTIGGIGAHKFYLGRTSEGWVYLLLCWTFIPAIVALFDGFSYLAMSDHRFAERYGSLNESRAAPNRSPMTAGEAVRWTIGVGMLTIAIRVVAEPGGSIGALILSLVGFCLIPPTWNWMCGTSIARRFGPQISFWGLTIFSGFVILAAIVGLVTSPNDRAAMPFFALFGLSLLPSVWRWAEYQCQKPKEFFTKVRWCLGLTGLVMAGAVAPSQGQSPSTHEVRITRDEYGDAWPFTVNEGILAGKKFGESVEVTFAEGESTYYLNGTAQQSGKYADLHEIWANDGEAKKSVSPITGRGVKLASGIDEPFVKRVVVAPSPTGPVRCDRFDLSASFDNTPTGTQGSLHVKLDTDLPDSTEVTISVSRGYFNAADREEYVIEYFMSQSTVGEWRRTRSIALDHLKWERALAKSRESFAAVGGRFRINGVNGYIEVGAVVSLPEVRSLNIVGTKVRSDTVSDYAHLRWNVKTK